MNEIHLGGNDKGEFMAIKLPLTARGKKSTHKLLFKFCDGFPDEFKKLCSPSYIVEPDCAWIYGKWVYVEDDDAWTAINAFQPELCYIGLNCGKGGSLEFMSLKMINGKPHITHGMYYIS